MEAAEGPAEGAAGGRQPRRGPAPIASFDHDGSDESSPETKQTLRLPEIREHPAGGAEGARARSQSTGAVGALPPPAPRIDISRASSSSHHDSRDSSPELALFAGDAGERAQRLELGFREDGALELRSSTEELSFLEPAPGEPRPAPAPAPPAAAAPPAPPAERRHSRKDSQSSEAALLAVSGRTSRLSSVGSACSAQSALSRVSRLSVVSGASRSPSPHRMLLETSFCGPKPIETDPEACAAAVAEHILEIAKMGGEGPPPPSPAPAPTPAPATPAPALDARDHRSVRTEVCVEAARGPAPARGPRQPALALSPVMAPAPRPAPEPRGGARAARPRVRREPSEPEVYKSDNRSKDIIRIKLRPDDDDDERGEEREARKPGSLALEAPAAPAALAAAPAPAAPALSPGAARRRSPSPLGPPSVSRKSSFCSLFKSRETIGSPESPQAQELRRKRSLTEGRARSKSRDRSATPTSGRLRGSVLSLFRSAPRRGAASSPPSRAPSPAPAAPACPAPAGLDKLKYYEEAKNGVIHIPLRTPPEERGAGAGDPPRPASAPQAREPPPAPGARSAPVRRTVLPDGSIIIPLRSPTERAPEPAPEPPAARREEPEPAPPAPAAPGRAASAGRAGSAGGSPSPVEAPVASPPSPRAPAPAAETPEPPTPDVTGRRRKERLVFTTHVGSREQVFSTQFSITKTPSVTSEISSSFPSFDNGELRDTHIAAEPATAAAGAGSRAATPLEPPPEPPRDSSESEPSSEAAPPQAGNDVERRGLVVQESFEEELPYIPTTLPQERSVAVPMVPVRERGGVAVRALQRPRPPPPAPPRPSPAPAPAPAPPPADKLRIKLPRRPRVASAAPAPRPSRERTRSDSVGKQEWIDFEEVPERRKQPKRIQTLPAEPAAALFSYVEPEHCRCECHAHPPRPPDAALSSPAEGGERSEGAPFTSDLDLRPDALTPQEAGGGAGA